MDHFRIQILMTVDSIRLLWGEWYSFVLGIEFILLTMLSVNLLRYSRWSL